MLGSACSRVIRAGLWLVEGMVAVPLPWLDTSWTLPLPCTNTAYSCMRAIQSNAATRRVQTVAAGSVYSTGFPTLALCTGCLHPCTQRTNTCWHVVCSSGVLRLGFARLASLRFPQLTPPQLGITSQLMTGRMRGCTWQLGRRKFAREFALHAK